MVPNAALDKFHSLLMEDDDFNDAVMKVALKVASYYDGPGAPVNDDTLALANELFSRVSVA